ncbi:uncharacterized protein VTP21DRAFT_7905 [Calcarisporiella thermophila]|uniref:uncharacterized protein n=1 Tax=Calcarisporiella thermophila TaxID=911321 RepID=UPI0037449AAC
MDSQAPLAEGLTPEEKHVIELQTATPPARVGFLRLFRFAAPSDTAMMGVGLLGAAVVGVAIPFLSVVYGELVDTLTAYVLGRIGPEEFSNKQTEYCLFFLFIAIVTFICSYAYMSMWVYSGERQARRIREKYLEAILRQNIGYFDKIGAGEVASRITNDTHLIQSGISERIPIGFRDIFSFFAAFVIAFFSSWKLTLVCLAVVPPLAIATWLTTMFYDLYERRIIDLVSHGASIAEEAFAAIRTVHAFNAQRKIEELYNKSAEKINEEGNKKMLVLAIGLGAIYFFIYCIIVLAFWFGSKMYLNDEITPGKITNVFYCLMVGSLSIAGVGPALQAISSAIAATVKVYETIDRTSPIDSSSSSGTKLPAPIKGRIQLRDVCFRYPSRPTVPVLKNLSLDIEPGTTVALVGASGCGKSTIVGLVERFYDPISGQVLVDGVDVKELHLQFLRQQMAFVGQEPKLFNTTIAQNVAYGLIGTEWENAPREKQHGVIVEACRLANAHDFIMKLPLQYDTVVGDGGFLLSGGQKQRIAIARAIVRQPRILLLDEATSALDTQSEGIVQQALDRAAKGRTTIVIAHRLSTIRNADKIIVISKGEIIETGTHDELLKRERGMYALLVKAQMLKKNIADPKDRGEVDCFPPEDIDPSKLTEEAITKEAVETGEDPEAIRLRRLETGTSMRSAASRGPDSVYSIPKGNDLEEGESFGRKKYSLSYIIGKLFTLSKNDWHLLVVGATAAVLTSLAAPVLGFLEGSMLQAFTLPRDQISDKTNYNSLIFLAIAIAEAVFNFLHNYLLGLSSVRLTKTIRIKSFSTAMQQEVGWFDRDENTPGALASKLSTNATYVEGMSGATLGNILQSVGIIIAGLVLGLIVGWKMTLVCFTAVPVMLFSGYMETVMMEGFQETNRRSHEQSAQLACEATTAIRTVASLTREAQVLEQYHQELEKPVQKCKKVAFGFSLLYGFSESVIFLANALAFYYGGLLIKSGEYDIKQIFTAITCIIFGAQNAGRIFSYSKNMSRAKHAMDDIIALLERRPLIDTTSSEGLPIHLSTGEVRISNVHFRYPTRHHIPVLKGLSLKVNPGQFAAFVGPSGCGKSTIIGLLERFYDVQSGTVCLEGVNVSQANVSNLRAGIAIVSQEPILFDMSIKENILLGATGEPTQREIEDACRQANIHDFIMSLPDGYQTRVGARGTQLSGGQKQRVAIARALIRQPKLLLLDEATSALDSESEKVVQAALDAASQGRTTISIAHRLSTIQDADVIFVIKNGVIVEQGTHQELIERKGLYSLMVQEQDIDKSG